MSILTRSVFACTFFNTFLICAILPHQGRILVSGEAFDGNASFRFTLVNPSMIQLFGITVVALEFQILIWWLIKNGFYKCPLGDTSFTGMAELSPQLFLITVI